MTDKLNELKNGSDALDVARARRLKAQAAFLAAEGKDFKTAGEYVIRWKEEEAAAQLFNAQIADWMKANHRALMP